MPKAQPIAVAIVEQFAIRDAAIAALTARVTALETNAASVRQEIGDLMGAGVHASGGVSPSAGQPLAVGTVGTVTVVAPTSGAATPVTYPAPVASGGTPPYTTTTTPNSGTSFPTGTTPVVVSTTDSTPVVPVTVTGGITVTVVNPTGAGSGSTTYVHAGGNLQTAINAAAAGDTLVLDAGATFTGNFTLPKKSGVSYITITTSGTLPSNTTRILPSDAAQLPILTSANSASTIATDLQSHHWRLLGLNIQDAIGQGDMVTLGDGAQTALSDVAHDLIVDRCLVQGVTAGGTKRGIALNSKDTTIVNCYISGIRRQGQDSQAVCGWNGPGNFLIENNYLEAASENIAFGGADPQIANLVPTNITIRGNYVAKPLAWKSQSGFVVKNLLEFKNGKTIRIENNVFENSWVDGQVGIGILFTVRNQDGTAPWSTIQDVTVTYNLIKNAEGPAVGFLGLDDRPGVVSVQGTHFVLNNLLVTGTSTRFIQSQSGFQPTTITHCTMGQVSGQTIAFGLAAMPSGQLTCQANVCGLGAYGITGTGAVGVGTPSLNELAPGSVFTNNVFGGPSYIPLPTGNTTIDANALLAQLDPQDRYTGPVQSADGLPMGCDIDGLRARIPWAVWP